MTLSAGPAGSADVVLSSGFLAFARHCGFLRAVEEVGLDVPGVCGTSSGALIGSLWCAGLSAEEIAARVSEDAPIRALVLHGRPWAGVFKLDGLLERLGQWLPARFEDLKRPLAVGLMTMEGAPELRTQGALREAVAASCAIPKVFAPVVVECVAYQDGGMVDRTFLGPYRQHRGPEPRLVAHIVDRSGGATVEAGTEHASMIVRTPRSGASFFSLGDFSAQVNEARMAALGVLRGEPVSGLAP